MKTNDTQSLRLYTKPICWGFTGTLLWGVVIILISAAIQFGSMLTYLKIMYGGTSNALINQHQYNGTALALSSFATLGVCGILICGIIKLKKGSQLTHYLAIHKINSKQIILWSVIALVITLLIDSLTFLQGKPVVVDFMIRVYSSTSNLWLLSVALIITAPVFEEMLFRGFLLSGFSATFLGQTGAIIATSLAWATIHIQYDIYGIFTIFITGTLLGIARIKSNSILTPILMHALMNSIAIIETAMVVH